MYAYLNLKTQPCHTYHWEKLVSQTHQGVYYKNETSSAEMGGYDKQMTCEIKLQYIQTHAG